MWPFFNVTHESTKKFACVERAGNRIWHMYWDKQDVRRRRNPLRRLLGRWFRRNVENRPKRRNWFDSLGNDSAITFGAVRTSNVIQRMTAYIYIYLLLYVSLSASHRIRAKRWPHSAIKRKKQMFDQLPVWTLCFAIFRIVFIGVPSNGMSCWKCRENQIEASCSSDRLNLHFCAGPTARALIKLIKQPTKFSANKMD